MAARLGGEPGGAGTGLSAGARGTPELACAKPTPAPPNHPFDVGVGMESNRQMLFICCIFGLTASQSCERLVERLYLLPKYVVLENRQAHPATPIAMVRHPGASHEK
jgi:hypothetical protein